MCFGFAATHCNTLQHTATHCNTLQHTATHCNTLQHTAIHCNTLKYTKSLCYILQHSAATIATHATHCNTLLYTATLCYILQHSATDQRLSKRIMSLVPLQKRLIPGMSAFWHHTSTHTHTYIHTQTQSHSHTYKLTPVVRLGKWMRCMNVGLVASQSYWISCSFANKRYRNSSVYKMIQMRIKSNALSKCFRIVWIIQMHLNYLNCPNAYLVKCVIQMHLNYLNNSDASRRYHFVCQNDWCGALGFLFFLI